VQLSVRQREFLEALSQTENLPLDRLQSYQRNLLEPLLKHAASNVPFYRNRLDAVLGQDGAVDWSRWREIPIFGKTEAQVAGADLQTQTLPVGNERWVEDGTPGSIGAPLLHRRSNLTDLASRCQTQRDLDWWKIDFGQTLAYIGDIRHAKTDPLDGLKLKSWNMRGDGSFVALDQRTNIEQQIQWLQRVKPRYLFTYPSLLRDLVEYILTSGQIGFWFDTIVTTGEPLPPEVRIKTQKAFGVRIFDRYGAQEIGHLAAECPSCGQYHISAESVLMEILNDDGTPTKPGNVGRVVVTSLYNYAMPFIRYDLEDIVEVGRPDICLRRLPTLRRIFGRVRNVFTRPDGTLMAPDLRSADLQRFVDFVQMKITQISRSMIEVRYVPGKSGRTPDESGLRDHFLMAIYPELSLRVVAVDAIPRLPSGKYEDYVSKVSEDTKLR
jgi:phenylacetate-CoA ligase